MSTVSVIFTALSSLQAQMQALDTTGHNIANVNTKGYRRQEAIMSAKNGYPAAGSSTGPLGGMLGTGVDVISIRRSQDAYLGLQLHASGGQLSQWTTAKNTLDEIQDIVQPSSESDLGTILDEFWNAWQALSTSPDDMSARAEVRAQGITVASSFRDLNEKLRWEAANIDSTITGDVEEINQLARQASELNRSITVAMGEGRQPNDLLDQRDQIFSRLAELTGATLITPETGQPILALNGKALVQGDLANQLTVARNANGYLEVRWQDDNTQVTIDGGQLGGKFQVRDQLIPTYLDQLDEMASTLVTQVNTLHASGYGLDGSTDVNFFTAGSTAGNITVDAAILEDSRKIAAATIDDAAGDGSIAAQIADLSDQPIMPNGQTVNQVWQFFLSKVGTDVKQAGDNQSTYTALYDQLFAQQQSLSGVSLDEESAMMVQYQHAYDAAARVLSIADQLMQTVIEQMGA
jgi:flagellar hook-associated protein 1